MALGVLNSDDYQAELESHSRKFEAKILTITRGRGNASSVPMSLRKVIAEEAIKGVSAAELSNEFGVSQSSVSAYKNGATSTASYNDPNVELTKHVDDTKEAISKIARTKMVAALQQITPERLGHAKLKDASQIAKDMSAIVRNMEPDKETDEARVTFNIYAPPPKAIEQYQVIDVKE